jgi:hypothetical protein
LRGLLKWSGHLGWLLSGIVLFGVAAWLDQHGYLSAPMEAIVAALPIPSAFLVAYLFMRDWRTSVMVEGLA